LFALLNIAHNKLHGTQGSCWYGTS